MQITLNLKKKLEQSANEYFEKAKKSRKKAEGAHAIVLKFQKKLIELEKKQQAAAQKETEKKQKAPAQWYEKFRWFISSEGFLCIGGKDATSNEVVIKKHTDKDDVVFHTEAPGSPFFVIKTEGKKPSDITMQETADATACFSKAWKIGVSGSEATVKTHCKEYAVVLQGRDKPSDCAKKIARKIKADIDEVLRALPAGT